MLAITDCLPWQATSYEVIDIINDKYFFAGPSWNTQIAKRFILKNKRVNKIIEASFYLHLDKHGKPVNVAFEPSTSFGCSVGCLFCASGNLFPIRALNAQEIVEQIDTLIRIYRTHYPFNHSEVREDVFYSGIGEPSLMTNTLIDASQQLLNMYPHMHFKMSTMGALPSALMRWAEIDVPLRTLQIGIPHWDNDKIKALYSKCSDYDLQQVLEYVRQFMTLRPKTRIKINYIGIKGFNDTEKDLVKTLSLITSVLSDSIELKISCLNPTEFAKSHALYTLTKNELFALAKCAQQLNLKNIYAFGPMSEKNLGCGQLAGNYNQANG